MLLLVAVWLIVLGYASLYVGYNTISGKTVTFKDAFLGAQGG